MDILDDIERLLVEQGAARYETDEPTGVTQFEHALQTAALAERAGAHDELVVAALLHDLGHLLHAGVLGVDRDDLHEYLALPFLRQGFGAAVLEPIRLHVAAKRFLCATVPTYHAALSPASVHSLALQGGPYTPQQAEAFMRQPFALDAVALRRWDDAAKNANARTPRLAHFRLRLQRCVRCLAEA